MRKKKTNKKSQVPNIKPEENGGQEGDPEATVKKNSGVNRRSFLLAGGSAAAAAIATRQLLVNAQQGRGRGTPQQGKGISALDRGGNSSTSPAFSEPDVAPARYDPTSGTNVATYNLNAALFDLRFSCNGQTTYAPQVPVFNTKVPGPTFYVDPGGLMDFTLSNHLNSTFPGDKCTMGTATIHAKEMQGEAHACPTPAPGATPSASPTPAPPPGPPPGCFNHTNLHTHGLFVSPCSIDKNNQPVCGATTSDKILYSSDDVLVDIPPGGSNAYRIWLPSFHAPGTHWYHSHLHGASGWQVSSGMAGAIIVREPYGKELVQADRDSVFLMQEVVFGTDGQYPIVYTQNQFPTSTTAGFLMNGQCQPTLQIVAGLNYRWRFINGTATPRGLMKLRLVKCNDDPKATCDESIPPPPTPSNPNTLMYLIAVDGISFYGFPPQPVRAHLLGPGNRADFLINILQPGKYKLVKDAFPKDATTVTDYTNVIPPTTASAQVLAFIEVSKPYGPAENIPSVIPGDRPLYLQAIDKVDKSDKVITFFSDNQGGTGLLSGRFQMNFGYYPCNDDLVVPLNTAEEISIKNLGPPAAGQMPHTFHIHVNPFQMVARTIDFEVENADLNNPQVTRLPNRIRLDRNNPCNWMWMDTLALPPVPQADNPQDSTKVRSRFLVYNGEYVSHCHLLIHEDVGMMMNVRINGNGIAPNQPLKDYPPEALACINRTKKTC